MSRITKFTASELQTKSSDLYNKVLSDGAIIIEHRSRPDMVLIRKDVLDKVLIDDKYKAVMIADLTF